MVTTSQVTGHLVCRLGDMKWMGGFGHLPTLDHQLCRGYGQGGVFFNIRSKSD
ncbi:MAG: hypothetical protein H3C57_01215 [Gammaproteobacteria bacterium]|nr:hypothetical protein [Gammaproteobacteria bacterium]